MKPNWITSLAGFIIAVGAVLSGISDPTWIHWVGQILTAIGSLVLGGAAADARNLNGDLK